MTGSQKKRALSVPLSWDALDALYIIHETAPRVPTQNRRNVVAEYTRIVEKTL